MMEDGTTLAILAQCRLSIQIPRTRVTHEYQEDSDSDVSLHSESGDSWGSFKVEFCDGKIPKHIWRTKPDVQLFNPLMKALVAAVLRMPNLQNMMLTIAMDEEMAFVGMEKHSVGIEFAGVGIGAWHGMSQLTDDEGLNRCFMNLKPQTRWDVLKDIVNVFVQEICGRSRRCFRRVR